MEDWDSAFRELADDPSDYEREGSTATLVRRGEDHFLSFREAPGVGVAIEVDSETEGRRLVPVSSFIQTEILGLPRLASQIERVVQRAASGRPGKFIRGPAACEEGKKLHQWSDAGSGLRSYILEPEAGTTRLVQLMAVAGQGKTVLLDEVAADLARGYQPEQWPVPILLPIDLLGRYVGNIDDAIAGTLNNTYRFPLTQRDVALCVRKRWIVLALDAFDELVARIGARDAFLHITQLLDQLDSSGTVILSARESFFELYQVSAAIRTYLQPKSGTYSTSTVRLLPWTQSEGEEVFRGLGSASPETDFASLSEAFEGDDAITLHPFFLTRLASLWMKGERFSDASGQRDRLSRMQYVIETFVQREVADKWSDQNKNPLISVDQHREMLGGIAAEMWRSGVFSMDAEELRLSAQIGLEGMPLSQSQMEAVIARVPTHGVLVTHEKGYRFLHDRFLHFFLAWRIARLLEQNDSRGLIEILSGRELGPDVADWVPWSWMSRGHPVGAAITQLNRIRALDPSEVLGINLGAIALKLLDKHPGGAEPIQVSRQLVVGDGASQIQLNKVEFFECEFWQADFSDSALRECAFQGCRFTDFRISKGTELARTAFRGCEFSCLTVEDLGSAYSPADIEKVLRSQGAVVEGTQEAERPQPAAVLVNAEVLLVVEMMVRASQRSFDFLAEEIEDEFSNKNLGRAIMRMAVDAGVLKQKQKDTPGSHKDFYRFAVDRERLRRGHMERADDARITEFWRKVNERYPA